VPEITTQTLFLNAKQALHPLPPRIYVYAADSTIGCFLGKNDSRSILKAIDETFKFTGTLL